MLLLKAVLIVGVMNWGAGDGGGNSDIITIGN